MEKIIYWLLNRMGDKLLHCFLCLIYAYITSVIVLYLSNNYLSGILAGLLAAMGLGIGKEIADYLSPENKWDWYDILADCIGTVSGVALACLTYLII